MRFRLGTIDRSFVPTKLTVSYVAICTGEVDADLLRRAFALTCRRYPMLSGRVECIDGDCHLRIPDHGNDATETVHASVSDWLATGLGASTPQYSWRNWRSCATTRPQPSRCTYPTPSMTPTWDSNS